jgi:glyoxylase I family protein
LDLFGEPDLTPPNPDPEKTFTRAYHLAFDIDPQLFDRAVTAIRENKIAIAYSPVRCVFLRSRWLYD